MKEDARQQLLSMVGGSLCAWSPRLDTRHVVKWTAWNSFWASFRAELVDGSKMKFDGLLMLFVFHLGCSASRAIDQWVISPQYGNVNVLKMVTETRLRRSRLGQTDLNFLYVPLQDVSYKFYFGIKPSYLTKL
jgi:hypothetical protein